MIASNQYRPVRKNAMCMNVRTDGTCMCYPTTITAPQVQDVCGKASNQIRAITGCEKTRQGNVLSDDNHGAAGPRCVQHGAAVPRAKCNVDGCGKSKQGNVLSDDEYSGSVQREWMWEPTAW